MQRPPGETVALSTLRSDPPATTPTGRTAAPPSPPSQYSLAALRSSVTRPATPVSESITAAPLRDESPVVSLRMQDKLHYPVGAVVSHLAIGKSRFRLAVMTFPTC